MQTRSARFMSRTLGERHHVERQVIVAAHVGQRTLIERFQNAGSESDPDNTAVLLAIKPDSGTNRRGR